MKKKYYGNRKRKMEWTNDEKEKALSTLDFAIDASGGEEDDYMVGFRNGLRYAKSLIDGNYPQYEHCSKQDSQESEDKE